MKITIHKRLPLSALALLLMLFVTMTTHGQVTERKGPTVPSLEVGFNYSWLHTNAPPGSCGCFSANGGGADAVLNLPHGIGVVGEVSLYQRDLILGTTQNVFIVDGLFGGRYTVGVRTRLRPYAQALLGVSHENSNYAYLRSADAFTTSVGGGVHLQLDKTLGINLLQADWVHSMLPNGSNNRQNDVRLGAGIYLTFGSH